MAQWPELRLAMPLGSETSPAACPLKQFHLVSTGLESESKLPEQ